MAQVGLLSGATPAKPRPRAMSFAGVRQMVAGERGPREGRAAFAMAAADRGGPTASSSYHSQVALGPASCLGRLLVERLVCLQEMQTRDERLSPPGHQLSRHRQPDE
jgi:hypothetical protein